MYSGGLYFEQMLFLVTLYSSKKNVSLPKKQYEAHISFNTHIHNQHIMISEDHVTLKTEAENTEINYSLKYIKTGMQYYKLQ